MILLHRLGFMLSEKSELQPMRRIIFLGFLVDLEVKRVYLTPEKIQNLIHAIKAALEKSHASIRQLMKLIRLINAGSRAIPFNRLHLRKCQLLMLRLWDKSWSNIDLNILITTEMKEAFSQWLNKDWLSQGLPLKPPIVSKTIFTDSSTYGWGGYLEDPHQDTSGTWSPEEKSLHINCLEMRAVANTIKAFAEELRNEVVMVATDNSTVVNYINKEGGTRSFSLEEESIKLFEITMALNVHLRARHIAGSLNLVAGTLSREGKGLPTEWSLNESVFRALSKEYGLPEVDLFATRLNRKIDVYFSPVPDSLAIGADALVHDWSNKHSYAFPPFALIPKVLEKVRKSVNCRITLIAPRWPRQAWYTNLLNLLVDLPIPLGD